MTHASLFSGIGGCEVAAAMIGWENLFHCEINPFGRAVLDYWFPKSKSYEDITKTNFQEWQGRVDVLTGGFPCQPFSYAGQRRGAEDDRYLWPEMLRAIQECQPTWVIGENVAGIATMVEQGEILEMGNQTSLFGETDDLRTYEMRSRFTLERVCSDLESCGYEVQPILIPACAVGAPHRRDRIFIIGHLVADSDSCHDGRDTREDASESREGTPQEGGGTQESWSNGHAEPSQRGAETKRPDGFHAVLRSSQDSVCLGCEGRDGIGQHSSLIGNAGAASNDGKIKQHKVNHIKHSGGGQNDTNTKRNGWYEKQLFTRFIEESQQTQCGDLEHGGATRAYMFQRWRRFPTEPPIHRGNDGLPFDVDCLTLPWVKWRPTNAKQPNATFSKWREESLKAYGNAIVPQVVYEIFRAIEQTYKQ